MAEGDSTAQGDTLPGAENLLFEVRENFLLAGRVRLLQPTKGFRSGLDAVFLAAAVPAVPGERVHEAGSGSGAGVLCVAARVPDTIVTGIEIQDQMTALARTNAALNGYADRAHFYTGDITAPPDAGPEFGPETGPADHVMMNPPYQERGKARQSPVRENHLSRMEENGDLKDWVAYGLDRVKPQGSLSIVHRADRLDDLLACLRGRAGEIAIFPLWPGAGKPAKRVIVRARKGVRGRMRMLPGMVLHRPDGAYTEDANQVLRSLAPLPL
jgi:tRNA1(Val) A37 N6-methylase TrmN6